MREAEDTLRPVGWVAMFISDDGYLVGPPGEVTQAFNSFKDAIERNCGLTLQTNKCGLLVGSGSRPEGCCPEVALGASLWVEAGSRASFVWGSPSGQMALSEP